MKNRMMPDEYRKGNIVEVKAYFDVCKSDKKITKAQVPPRLKGLREDKYET